MRLIDADVFFKNYPELDIEPYNNTPTITIKEWVEEMPLYIKDAMLEALLKERLNTMSCIDCIHKDVCYKYRLNYVSVRDCDCINYSHQI